MKTKEFGSLPISDDESNAYLLRYRNGVPGLGTLGPGL